MDSSDQDKLEDKFTQEEIETCLRVLQSVADDPLLASEHDRFKGLVTKIYRTATRQLRAITRAAINQADNRSIQTTGIIEHRYGKQSSSPMIASSSADPYLHSHEGDSHANTTSEESKPSTLIRSKNCYICKQPFQQLHSFYHMLCPACAEFNFSQRERRADLRGRVALVTGGRIKIGFQVVLKLLRDGAKVIATTRFPNDALARYQKEADFEQWEDRLEVHSLELRNLPTVEMFAENMKAHLSSLDILIHNAAQTIRRPKEFYQHLLNREASSPGHPRVHFNRDSLALLERQQDSNSLINLNPYFPVDCFDADGQQVDKRPHNSWRMKIGEVDTVEMLEAYFVNAAAPFQLTNHLLPLMRCSNLERRFIVNVSAMEGQFTRATKTANHPHTNMAKAALNMLTRTSAADLAKDGIYMTSVDTGWITDENPMPIADFQREEHGFYTPLDVVDAAARIYSPIVEGVANPSEPPFGCFLKDYKPYPW